MAVDNVVSQAARIVENVLLNQVKLDHLVLSSVQEQQTFVHILVLTSHRNQ